MLRFAQELLRYAVPVGVVVVGVMLFYVVKQREPPQSKEDTPDRRPIVQTSAVGRHQGGLQIEVDGLVVPYREILTSAEVGGRIVSKSPKCEAGMFVEQGEVLLTIDPEDYRLEFERLASEIKQAQFNLEEVNDDIESTQELIKLARRDLELRRAQHQRLVEARRQNSAISVQQVDEAEQSVIAAHNALLQLDSQLAKARIRASGLEQAIKVNVIRHKQAKRDLDRTTITAPVSGVIIREEAEQDSYVRMGDPLVIMEDTSAVEVRCNLKMEELRWIWNQAGVSRRAITGDATSVHQYRLPPTPVEIRYELGGDVFIWDGMLSRFDGLGLDERTRTVPCLVVVNEPSRVRVEHQTSTTREGPRALVRGMFVTAIIKTQPNIELLSVPEEAVQPGNVVWVVKEGRLRRAQVTVAQTIGKAVIADAGDSELSPGDRVVISPLSVAYSGMEVREEGALANGSARASPSRGASPSQGDTSTEAAP